MRGKIVYIQASFQSLVNIGYGVSQGKACFLWGSGAGISCAVIAQAGKHDWPFAARVFAASLPWLAGAIGTPGDPVVPLRAPAPVLLASPPALPRMDAPAPTAQAAGR